VFTWGPLACRNKALETLGPYNDEFETTRQESIKMDEALITSPSRLRNAPIGTGKKIAVLMGSLVSTLVVLEVVFRLLGYEPLHAVYSKPEIFWQHDPLLGWSHEPGAKDVYRGPRPFPIQFAAPVAINSLGLRSPEVVPVPPGGQRVLLLGDSMIAGFEVPEEQHVRSLLERELTAKLERPIQVVNAGVRGYGTDQTWMYFKERGYHLKPDVVVFVHSSNDLEDDTTLHRPRRPFGKPAFALQPDGSLKLVGSPVPDYPYCSSYRTGDDGLIHREDGVGARTMCWFQTQLQDKSAFFTFVAQRLNAAVVYKLHRMAGFPQLDAAGLKLETSTKVTGKLLDALADSVRQSGAEFRVVMWRSEWEGLRGAASALSESRMIFIDPVYANMPLLEITFNYDSHLNQLGHKRFAAVLEEPIENALRAHLKEAPQADNPLSRAQ